jgi:hypothetical protein
MLNDQIGYVAGKCVGVNQPMDNRPQNRGLDSDLRGGGGEQKC